MLTIPVQQISREVRDNPSSFTADEKKKLNEILAANTGQTVEKIAEDTERDNFMSAEEAKAYGLIDEIVESRNAAKEKE